MTAAADERLEEQSLDAEQFSQNDFSVQNNCSQNNFSQNNFSTQNNFSQKDFSQNNFSFASRRRPRTCTSQKGFSTQK